MVKRQEKKNIFDNVSLFDSSAFLDKQNISTQSAFTCKQKTINDFDSSLILENIDKTAKNKAVKINLRINTLEKNLAKVSEELELIKLLNLEKDKDKREQLTKLKKNLELQITNLKKERKNFGILYSMTGFLEEKIYIKSIINVILTLCLKMRKYYFRVFDFLKNKKIFHSIFKW